MFPLQTPILLAEDTEITRVIVHKMLYNLGFLNVHEVKDGKEAQDKIEAAIKLKKPYELLIIDWNMPEVTGLTLLRKLRSDPRTESVPFVMLTTNKQKHQVLEAIRSGVTTYLSKPFSVEVLRDKLKETWDVTHKRKAA